MTRITRFVAAFVLGAIPAALASSCARPAQPRGPTPSTPAALPAAVGSSASPAAGATPHMASTTVPVPGGCDQPRTGPSDAFGCYVAGTEQIGVAPATPLFWHLDTYPTRSAAELAQRGRGTVAQAHGRVWLFTIAEAEWRSEGGQRVARVGPLPLTPGRIYAAHYLDGVVPPGARTPVHRHAGPEAWYVVEGTNCLETPDGVRVARAGESLIVPEGPPMVLTGVGATVRRSLALVVHDAAQPWTIPVSDWTPKGACPR